MKNEILRDRIGGQLSPELVELREKQGWRLAAVEWEREGSQGSNEMQPPYGLRVAGDCQHLEEHPDEREVLRTVMRMIVHDKPLSKITEELNRLGYRTRSGRVWGVTDVFQLMPNIVESGPRMFADPGWTTARGA